MRLGADGTGSNVSSLKSLGATFISRYTSEQSWALTASEAKTLSSAGIDIVSNYEHYTTDYAGGFSQGVTNAKTGWAVHKRCGGPDNRPIYFSVDTDVDPSNSSLHEYFRGACSVLGGAHGVGVYGSTGVCEALRSAGLVAWTWRTMSTGWHGGAGSTSMFNVEQTGYFNSTYDRDVAITDDFGQWRVGVNPAGGGGTVTPPPVPKAGEISLSILQMCAHEDPSRPQGSTTNSAQVLPVERALCAEGLLPLAYVDGYYGTLTIGAYAAWQHKLGYTGTDADGIPGMTSLSKLGAAHGFTVGA